MTEKNSTPIDERVRRGQSAALGDTGTGNTGVASHQQGISNRQGDTDSAVRPGADDEAVDDDDAIEVLDEADDDDDADDEEEDDAEDEEDAEDEGEMTDPAAEPGKPI
jgi:hypothetical protein